MVYDPRTHPPLFCLRYGIAFRLLRALALSRGIPADVT
jgi:hypothetical protein